jgi:hypothetical protein
LSPIEVLFPGCPPPPPTDTKLPIKDEVPFLPPWLVFDVPPSPPPPTVTVNVPDGKN